MCNFLDTWFRMAFVILIIELLIASNVILRLNNLLEVLGCLFGISLLAIQLGFVFAIIVGFIILVYKFFKNL